MRREQRLTKKRKVNRIKRKVKFGIVFLVCLTVLLWILHTVGIIKSEEYWELSDAEITAEKPEIQVDLLDINKYSRPGDASDKIEGIVIHYTANPGSTAQQNRDYFNGLQESHTTKASSHFIIGIDGEIVQCVPTWEIAYASNERNHDTVSIECCHKDDSGEFTKETYQSVIQLTAWLCEKFGLSEEDVIRHYDVTGKICPKYFVEHEDAWGQLKLHIKKALEDVE